MYKRQRLRYPWQLTEAAAGHYRAFLAANTDRVLARLLKAQDNDACLLYTSGIEKGDMNAILKYGLLTFLVAVVALALEQIVHILGGRVRGLVDDADVYKRQWQCCCRQ